MFRKGVFYFIITHFTFFKLFCSIFYLLYMQFSNKNGTIHVSKIQLNKVKYNQNNILVILNIVILFYFMEFTFAFIQFIVVKEHLKLLYTYIHEIVYRKIDQILNSILFMKISFFPIRLVNLIEIALNYALLCLKVQLICYFSSYVFNNED